MNNFFMRVYIFKYINYAQLNKERIISKLRTMFREKISNEKREKLKKFLKYEGNTHYQRPNKPYINGFLDGQNKEVIKKQILIESLHGKDINGHLFAL